MGRFLNGQIVRAPNSGWLLLTNNDRHFSITLLIARSREPVTGMGWRTMHHGGTEYDAEESSGTQPDDVEEWDCDRDF